MIFDFIYHKYKYNYEKDFDFYGNYDCRCRAIKCTDNKQCL